MTMTEMKPGTKIVQMKTIVLSDGGTEEVDQTFYDEFMQGHPMSRREFNNLMTAEDQERDSYSGY